MSTAQIKDVSALADELEGFPWCIVGRGRSIDLATKPMWDNASMGLEMKLMGINDGAMAIRTPDISMLTDYENWTDMSDADPGKVLLQYYPHFRYGPFSGPIEDFMKSDRRLRALAQKGQLFGYDLCSIKDLKRSPFPTIQAFSSCTEAAVDLLVKSGHRRIWTLGLDVFHQAGRAMYFRSDGMIDVMRGDGRFVESHLQINNHRAALANFLLDREKAGEIELMNLVTGKPLFRPDSIKETGALLKELNEHEGTSVI